MKSIILIIFLSLFAFSSTLFGFGVEGQDSDKVVTADTELTADVVAQGVNRNCPSCLHNKNGTLTDTSKQSRFEGDAGVGTGTNKTPETEQ